MTESHPAARFIGDVALWVIMTGPILAWQHWGWTFEEMVALYLSIITSFVIIAARSDD